MSLGSSLRRAIGSFDGGAHDAYNDETITSAQGPPQRREEPSHARRLRHQGAADYDEIYADQPPPRRPRGRERAARPLALARPYNAQFCLVVPQEFNDAQQIADRFRADVAVICDLQGCETQLARRLTDFCAGLTYALDGRLQRLDESILLLVPRTVELSSEAAAGLLSEGFFNQL